jgi:methyltransferase (TIGR00027 family)
MADTPIHDVSDTALWVAVYRARETERPDALFRDPFAAKLAGERGRQIAAKMWGSQYTQWSVVIRTVIIDDFLRTAIAGGVDTVVNLGAGLDARPYRLDLPATLRWVEVDYPAMIALKADRLRDDTPRCRLERVGLDLADVAARGRLLDELAGSSRQTLILTEGVVPYLTEEQVASLAADLRARPSFRHWIIDYFSPEVIRYVQTRRKRQMQNAPFRFAPADWFAFFARAGWRARETRYLADEAARLSRRTPMPLLARLLRFFMPKETLRRHQRFAAYVHLVPDE